MKVYVYHTEDGFTSCYPDEKPRQADYLVQVIEAEETIQSISDFKSKIFIEVGEVFACNNVISNLIRIA
jgi:hypothetical protein